MKSIVTRVNKAWKQKRLRSAVLQELIFRLRRLQLRWSPETYQDTSYYHDCSMMPYGLEVRVKEAPQAFSRLNIILPNGRVVASQTGFAGMQKFCSLIRVLAPHYQQVRCIAMIEMTEADQDFALEMFGDSKGEKIEFVNLHDCVTLDCHEHEIFICSYYRTVEVWEKYANALEVKGLNINKFYYLIQDFEPAFSPEGSKSLIAKSTYEHGSHTCAVIHTQELSDHLARSGYHFSETYITKVGLTRGLFQYLEKRDYLLDKRSDKKTQILIYGRPDKARACFELIVQGLNQYFRELDPSEHSQYEILSAGYPHPNITLFDGVVIKSLGKLEHEDYIKALESSDIGIVLMATPSPTPVLYDMLSFGLYSIGYGENIKSFSADHPRFLALDRPIASKLAATLREAKQALSKKRGQAPTRCTIPAGVEPLSCEEAIRQTEIKPIYSANKTHSSGS